MTLQLEHFTDSYFQSAEDCAARDGKRITAASKLAEWSTMRNFWFIYEDVLKDVPAMAGGDMWEVRAKGAEFQAGFMYSASLAAELNRVAILIGPIRFEYEEMPTLPWYCITDEYEIVALGLHHCREDAYKKQISEHLCSDLLFDASQAKEWSKFLKLEGI